MNGKNIESLKQGEGEAQPEEEEKKASEAEPQKTLVIQPFLKNDQRVTSKNQFNNIFVKQFPDPNISDQ